MSACPLCGGTSEPRLTTIDRNRGLGSEHFEYRRCASCGTVFLANPPEDMARFYPPAYYDSTEASETEQAKLAFLRRFAPGGRLVEIGPGAGGFAAAAKQSGYDVAVVEMDEGACRHLESHLGITAVNSDRPHEALANLPPSAAIVAWHVIEHLEDPWALVDTAATNLEPGGVLVIATPNPESFGLRVLGGRWAHVDAPRHRHLIPAQSLSERATAAGLQLAELTANDRAGRDWNVFAWQQLLLTPDSGQRRRRAAFYAGALAALLLAPVERRDLSGAAYTAVFRKDEAP
jgi:2-polyprenyl-3-methyl-5-hydroxy-6-metoxy-1,4-benzoquinol methylase